MTNEDLFSILSDPEPSRFALAARANFETKRVTIIKADLRRLSVPFEVFTPNPTATADFHDLEIIDWGLTLRLGKYEVDMDWLLNLGRADEAGRPEDR